MKKITLVKMGLLVLLLILSIGLISCSAKESAKEPTSTAVESARLGAELEYTDMGQYKKEPSYKIGYSFHGGGISFDIESINAFKWVAKEKYGNIIDELYVTEAQFDVSKQISDIEDLMAKGIDGLIVSPTSPSAIVPVIDKLYDQGIPVIIVLGEYDGSKYTAYRATDAQAFGRAGAEWLVDKLIEKYGEPKGDILAIRGVPGEAADVGRWDRGAKVIFDSYPNIKVVGEGAGLWAYDEGRRIAESLLTANPNVDGIWSCGGQMSLAAAEVVDEMGLNLIPITGEDYNGFYKYWVENQNRGFSSISPTYPSWLATDGLDTMVNVLMGQSVVKTLLYPPPIVTDETVGNYVVYDLPDNVWVATSVPHRFLEMWYK
ncbi:MAG: substrate-binding domain-containing protein [Bacteroidia bacterium]|nr:substrate-binding domain-containing protein [Bacteroidia bacterium]